MEGDDEGRIGGMHHHHVPHHAAHPQHRGNLQDIGIEGQLEDGAGNGAPGMDDMDGLAYRGGAPPHEMHRPIPEHFPFASRVNLEHRNIHNVLPPADGVVTAQQVQNLPHGYTIHDHQQRPHPMHHHQHHPMDMQHPPAHHQGGWGEVPGLSPSSPNGDQSQHHVQMANSSPYIPQDQPPSPPDSDSSVPVKETKKRKRQMKTPEQLSILEKEFAISPLPNKETRYRISSLISLTPRQVQIWFQNKRAKVKNAARKRNPNFSFQNSPGGPPPQQQTSPQHHHQPMPHYPQHAPPPYQQGYQFQAHYSQPPYDPQGHYGSPYAPHPSQMSHMMDAPQHHHHPHHPGMGGSPPQGGEMNMMPMSHMAPPQERKKRSRRNKKSAGGGGEYLDEFNASREEDDEEDDDEDPDEDRMLEMEERQKYMQQQRRMAEQHDGQQPQHMHHPQQPLHPHPHHQQPPQQDQSMPEGIKSEGEGMKQEKGHSRGRRSSRGGSRRRGSNGGAAIKEVEEEEEEEGSQQQNVGGGSGDVGNARDYEKEAEGDLSSVPGGKDEENRFSQVDQAMAKTKEAVGVRN